MVSIGVRKIGIRNAAILEARFSEISDPLVMTIHGMPISQMVWMRLRKVSGSKEARYAISEFPNTWTLR